MKDDEQTIQRGQTHTINTQQDDQGSRGSWATQEEQIRYNEMEAKLNTRETRTSKIKQEMQHRARQT